MLTYRGEHALALLAGAAAAEEADDEEQRAHADHAVDGRHDERVA